MQLPSLHLDFDRKSKFFASIEEHIAANWPHLWSCQGHIALLGSTVGAIGAAILFLFAIPFDWEMGDLGGWLAVMYLGIVGSWLWRVYKVPRPSDVIEFLNSPLIISIVMYTFMIISPALLLLLLKYGYSSEFFADPDSKGVSIVMSQVLLGIMYAKVLFAYKPLMPYLRSTGWRRFVTIIVLLWLFALAPVLLFLAGADFAGYVVIGLGLIIVVLRILFCFYTNKRAGLDSALLLAIYLMLLVGMSTLSIAAMDPGFFSLLQPQPRIVVIAFAIVFYVLIVDSFGSILARFLVLPIVGK